MAAKHTPGPWVTESDFQTGDTVLVEALTPDLRYVEREICFVLVGDTDTKEEREANRANLLLIAAAPDLLEAAKGALALIQSLKEREGFRGAYANEHELVRAIDKAESGS